MRRKQVVKRSADLALSAAASRIRSLEKRLQCSLKASFNKCCCPKGSLCEFFAEASEKCLYGEI